MEPELHIKRTLEEDTSNLDQNEVKKVFNRPTHEREYTTILVSNLPKSVNQGKIRKLFSDCGRIRYIDIVDTLDGSSRFAKIEFYSHDESLAALTKTHKGMGYNEITVEHLEDCTLWLTNFPPDYDVKQLKQLINSIDVIVLSVRLPSKRFNSNRRFAYVDVTKRSDASKCVEELNGREIDGYNLVVKLSNPLEKTKRTDAASLERREVFIRNLNPEFTSETEIRSHLNSFGEIESVHIPKHHSTELHNSCAFVTFVTKENAAKSLELNSTTWNDRNISVTIADKKSYLDRQYVKDLMSRRGGKDVNGIVTLFPIGDKVSKEQIRHFLSGKGCTTDINDIENIYLVTDHQGVIVKFKDAKLSAECILKVQGQRFYNKVLSCGTLNDLRNFREHPKDVKKNDSNPKEALTKPKHIISVETKKSDPSSKQPMSNDDFRKMFLGK